ncbi:MAG: hypothetical protein MK212_16140 [Saprospiraceae bacterium]|nr:hypothetical protein [Saprospiraceae bacterium]
MRTQELIKVEVILLLSCLLIACNNDCISTDLLKHCQAEREKNAAILSEYKKLDQEYLNYLKGAYEDDRYIFIKEGLGDFIDKVEPLEDTTYPQLIQQLKAYNLAAKQDFITIKEWSDLWQNLKQEQALIRSTFLSSFGKYLHSYVLEDKSFMSSYSTLFTLEQSEINELSVIEMQLLLETIQISRQTLRLVYFQTIIEGYNLRDPIYDDDYGFIWTVGQQKPLNPQKGQAFQIKYYPMAENSFRFIDYSKEGVVIKWNGDTLKTYDMGRFVKKVPKYGTSSLDTIYIEAKYRDKDERYYELVDTFYYNICPKFQ